ncbi:MAG: protein kinase [Lachnospiraceae bacterium]|nr:protein kinase [Lachnospiraceae bacterium]
MINPGTVLGNRYVVAELIGTGGMANVYKATDRKLNRNVAIKVLKDEYSSNKNFVSKFKAEAQAAAGLMHPNIVNVYDVGDENGIYYFVMELVEGITLKKYIEKKIRLSVKEATSIAIQVSMGIEAAHNNGIIHRDIKPQNIIISRDGKVKVADFGIARAATSDTITTHAMGSVHYTSPEQARGGYSDAKSDIYSIGITFFEMVTGRVPFDGETTVSIAIKHIQEEMPSPKMYVPEVPISVEQIIFKCTQKHPDKRYANIGELITDLKKSLINPDENFVVINDIASNAGTRTITDKDRKAIRNMDQDKQSGFNEDNTFNEPEPYKEEESYQSSEHYREEDMYVNAQGYPGHYQGAASYNDSYQQPYQDAYGNMEYAQRQQAEQGYSQGYVNPGYDPYQNPSYDVPKQYPPYPVNNQGSAEEDDDDDDLLDFLFTPGSENNDERSGSKSKNRQKQQDNKNRQQKKNGSNNRNHENRDSRERRDSRDSRDSRSGSRPDNRSSRNRQRQNYDNFRDEESSSLTPGTEKIFSIVMVIAAVIVAIIAIIAVGRVFGMFTSDDKDKLEEGMVYTPNVVGMTIDEASATLAELKLKATATYAESPVYEKDVISGQDPAPDTVVEEGTLLSLVVSSGKVQEEGSADVEITPEAQVTVPDVVGLPKAEAKVMLENEEFVVEIEEIKDSNTEVGSVVKQSPMGAESASPGSTVLIYVCSEKTEEEPLEEEAAQVSVPDLAGKDEASAKQLLSDAKLTYETVSQESNDSVAAGLVLSQTVAAGTMVEEGTTVNFTISKGPSTYSCNFSIAAPADYLAGTEATIILTDVAGNQIGSYMTSEFPYALVQAGITGSDSGIVTVTYQMLDGNWNTTAPLAAPFNKEN